MNFDTYKRIGVGGRELLQVLLGVSVWAIMIAAIGRYESIALDSLLFILILVAPAGYILELARMRSKHRLEIERLGLQIAQATALLSHRIESTENVACHDLERLGGRCAAMRDHVDAMAKRLGELDEMLTEREAAEIALAMMAVNARAEQDAERIARLKREAVGSGYAVMKRWGNYNGLKREGDDEQMADE